MYGEISCIERKHIEQQAANMCNSALCTGSLQLIFPVTQRVDRLSAACMQILHRPFEVDGWKRYQGRPICPVGFCADGFHTKKKKTRQKRLIFSLFDSFAHCYYLVPGEGRVEIRVAKAVQDLNENEDMKIGECVCVSPSISASATDMMREKTHTRVKPTRHLLPLSLVN